MKLIGLQVTFVHIWYRLNWARKTSWGWWGEWDDTALHTQDSKFEPWRSEAEHTTFRSWRLPTILTSGWGRNMFVSFKPPWPGNELRTLAWKAAVLKLLPCVPFSPDWTCHAEQFTNRWLPTTRGHRHSPLNITCPVCHKQQSSNWTCPVAVCDISSILGI